MFSPMPLIIFSAILTVLLLVVGTGIIVMRAI